ncbi:CybS-domain-containing protein [Apiospora hydei]|uniref:Succinate dehydrogenase [ubiquinone] cytochrome b small subunit n=1 Tax=Apiospora hydei TaxID=1337664 RepID=A0ABR1VXB5_9PEZI
MASIIRPALLRQTALAASTRRAAGVSTTLAQQSVRSAILKDSARCAAFHTSSRRSLLPPGPRMLSQSPCIPVQKVTTLTFSSQRLLREEVHIHCCPAPESIGGISIRNMAELTLGLSERSRARPRDQPLARLLPLGLRPRHRRRPRAPDRRPFAAGSLNPTFDALLCSFLLIHSHTGFQNIIVDYIPTARYPKSRKAAMWLLNLATVTVGIGLYEFETNDVGLTEAIKRVWKA